MIELLNKRHNRLGFDCGNEVLNNYLKHRASQDVKRKLAACFVFSEKASPGIMGFYTLPNKSIPLLNFPESLQKSCLNLTSLFPRRLLDVWQF